MSQPNKGSNFYTTGEIAKLCGVSVRTVQYYDNRNILIPSELSEGGRRLYSEDDLRRMKIICFLRDAGFPINSISALFEEEKPENIIELLLEQQEQTLREELKEQQRKLAMVEAMKRELKEIDHFSVESIGDIAHIMKQKNKLKRLRIFMLISGIPVTAFQWVAVVLGITHGLWWLLIPWACVAIPWGIFVSVHYFRHVDYICPACHEVFSPRFKEAFWAYHTPRMRRLTCPKCGRKGLCVEVYTDSCKEGKING